MSDRVVLFAIGVFILYASTALHWLAGAVRDLQRRVKDLEADADE